MKKVAWLAALLILALASPVLAQVDEDAPLDVRATALKLNGLLQKKDFDGAEKALEAALKASSSAAQLQPLRRNLAFAFSRAKLHQQAIHQAGAFVDFQLEQLKKDPAQAAAASTALQTLLFVSRKAEQPEAGDQKLETLLAALAALHEKQPEPDLANVLSQVKGAKISHLAETKRVAEAQALLEAELAQARGGFAQDKANLGAILSLANLLSARVDLLETTAYEQSPAAAKEFREFVAARAKEHSDKAAMVSLYLSARLNEFYEVVQANPDEAEKIQNSLRDYLSLLATENPAVKDLAARGRQLVTGMSRQLVSSRDHQALIGKPATPLDVQTWVNGPSLTDKDLEGKVVLLDFWAVWCGPCIATFPHLREWQEKYSAKGLVILGMTNYYEYDWNEAEEGIERVRGLSPEKEQAALLKFAAHHQLKHRFGVMPEDSDFAKSYGVQGIPQVVLIDRAGKVRMIRVGSGTRNAHDLEAGIAQALAAPVPAASAAGSGAQK